MDGGNEGQGATAHRRPWAWIGFVLVVAVLRFSALGSDAPTAGADAAPPAPVDGDPAVGERLAWIVADVDPLLAGQDAAACVEAGASCSGDQLLAVGTTAARAGALAAALTAATDPTDEDHLGRAPAAVRERVEVTTAAATAVAEALGTWEATGCGGAVDGVPVEVRPPACTELDDDALAALRAFDAAMERWGA